MANDVKSILKKIKLLVFFVRGTRNIYRYLRTKYLKNVYPDGGYIRCNGIKVYCDFNNPTYVWYDGYSPNLEYDQRVLRTLVDQGTGDVFLDIGAHFGFFSACFAEMFSRSEKHPRIIALEPDAGNFRCLQKTMECYSNNRNLRVTMMPYAVTDFDGHVGLYKSDADCLHTYGGGDAEFISEARAATLNTIVRECLTNGEKIALIKIDVDGAEPLFFRGGEEALGKHKPIVIMEFAPKYIRLAGEEPSGFYKKLCNSCYVYWISYANRRIRRVTGSDYDEIIKEVGDGITDLVLSYSELSFATEPAQ